MRCEHGNLIRLQRRKIGPPYFDDGVEYRFEGCQECAGAEIVEVFGVQETDCLWIPNDGGWYEGDEQ